VLVPPQFILLVSWLWSFFRDWWWLVSPPVFLFLLHDLWLFYIRWKRFLSTEFVLLEIRPPQVIERTPQAMEQVFAGLHGIYSKPKPHEKYLEGKVTDWVSCEIVSLNGESHFFIRVPARFRNLVEANIWAQYPDAEILEVDDYTRHVPRNIPNLEWEMWGTELALTKPDPYPIRTYEAFESAIEERRLDPLASLLELCGSLGPGEQLWFQILAEPVMDAAWHAEGKAIVAKLIGRQAPKKGGSLIEEVLGTIGNEIGEIVMEILRFLAGVFGPPQKPQKPAAEPPMPISIMMHLSPGEREVVEAIERNIAKLGFKTTIRVIYLAKREVYNPAMPAAIFGVIRQFNTQNLNGFMPNLKTLPNITYLFPKQRNYTRKRRLDWRYRYRRQGRKRFIFNIEELATVFHFPGSPVAKAPMVARISAKRGEPPQTLPMVSS
jgi:hypothetical protein